jgi:hypothetical protein
MPKKKFPCQDLLVFWLSADVSVGISVTVLQIVRRSNSRRENHVSTQQLHNPHEHRSLLHLVGPVSQLHRTQPRQSWDSWNTHAKPRNSSHFPPLSVYILPVLRQADFMSSDHGIQDAALVSASTSSEGRSKQAEADWSSRSQMTIQFYSKHM